MRVTSELIAEAIEQERLMNEYGHQLLQLFFNANLGEEACVLFQKLQRRAGGGKEVLKLGPVINSKRKNGSGPWVGMGKGK